MLTPSARSRSSTACTSAPSSINTRSVNSSSSWRGARPLRANACSTRSTNDGSANCQAETLMLIVTSPSTPLRQAATCRQVAAWRSGVLGDVTISINVSAWQLAEPSFVDRVEQALARNGLAPRQLELELTERVLIDDGADVHAVLERLRALGVSISLDDFGTGYSSLSYLTQFHLNTLKIDRAFVMDIEHSERSNNLVHAIIAMGHSLGLQLVAEGVETAGQAAILEKMGCHYLQGYHISRPIPAEELLVFADGLLARPHIDNFAI